MRTTGGGGGHGQPTDVQWGGEPDTTAMWFWWVAVLGSAQWPVQHCSGIVFSTTVSSCLLVYY